MHARARRLVGGDADDIVHEVFVRLLRSPPRPDQTASWLFVTTTNACLDRLRHAARRDETWRAAAGAALGGDEVDAERLLEAKDAWRRVLGILDAKTATVAAMVYVDGMSQEEVAAAMGVTRTAIAKRLTRFLRDARAELGCPNPQLARLKG